MDTGRTTMLMIAAAAAAITVAYRVGRRDRDLAAEVQRIGTTMTWLQQGQQEAHRGHYELKRGQAEINKRLDARTAELANIGEILMSGQRSQMEAVAGAWGALGTPTDEGGKLRRLNQTRSPRT